MAQTSVSGSGTRPSLDLMNKATELSKNAWIERIEPRLPRADAGAGLPTRWESRLSAPLPTDWPGQTLVVYAYARGLNFEKLRDAEFMGPVWARIVFEPEAKIEVLSTDVGSEKERVGVRPLSEAEMQILKLDPFSLLRSPASAERDLELKIYYCLRLALGQLPSDVIARHPKFFDWLSCAGLNSSSKKAGQN